MTRAALAILVMTTVACATTKKSAIDHQVSAGPTAEQMWTYHILQQAGREPNGDERRRWSDGMDREISQYLAQHPEVANDYDISTFRYDKQPVVGMTKEQVRLLLGQPESKTTDTGEMEDLARRFWPGLKKEDVTEAWVYPLGWRFFFSGPRVTAITQYLPPKE
jgi:hypothetical protein